MVGAFQVNGRPTGSVRVSFGYMSSVQVQYLGCCLVVWRLVFVSVIIIIPIYYELCLKEWC